MNLARDSTDRAFLVVALCFLGNGLGVGVLGGSLPGLKALLDLSAGHIVGILVTAGACAVVSMNLSGSFADRRGARLPMLLGGSGMAVGGVLLGAAPSYPWLLGAAAVFGLGNGAMDVSMNALGVGVEQARRRPVMSRLHACFSIGNLAGALLVVVVGGLVANGDGTRWALWSGAVLLGVLVLAVRPVTPHRTGQGIETTGGRRVPTVAWLLAAMAVCFGLTEGTGIDWSSLHVSEVGGVSPSAGAWGLACVSGFMVVIRLLGDAVVDRLGRAAVVRLGAGCALLGYLCTAFVDPLWAILAGWCLVGLGVGLIAPQIYGLAGHLGGGRGLALVVSFGYAAFLVGPGIIGLATAYAGLQRAMLVPTLTAAALIAMSARMPADPQRA